MKKLITIIFLSLLPFLFAGSAMAFQSSNIFVSVENPVSPTNKDKFDLSFTALDILNRPLTVKCFKVNPDSSEIQIGSDIALIAGGNSGECSLENYPLTESEKTYYFYATAQADGESYRSDSVAVDFNTSGPGTPTDYKKDKINNCRYDISFRASNDGKTDIIRIYRSENTKFTADNNSQIGQVGISPGQSGSFADLNIPDCNRSFYYVIRAFDTAGNGSGLAGDFITVFTSTGVGTTTSTVGAIPVSGSNIPQEEETSPKTDGSILGSEEKTSPKNFTSQVRSLVSRHKFTSFLSVLLLLIIIRYGIKRIRTKKK